MIHSVIIPRTSEELAPRMDRVRSNVVRGNQEKMFACMVYWGSYGNIQGCTNNLSNWLPHGLGREIPQTFVKQRNERVFG